MTCTLLLLGPRYAFVLGRSSANSPIYAPLPDGLLTITKYGYVVFHLYYISLMLSSKNSHLSYGPYPTFNIPNKLMAITVVNRQV